MKESEIDLSDMPEVLDWNGAQIGKYYRHGKHPAKTPPVVPGSKPQSEL